ncbi:IS630 family transposase [Salana multivorans]
MKAGLVKRARIVLLAADRQANHEIAARVGASRTTVIAWRNRYLSAGIAGLEDRDRPGRPRQVDHAALRPPPKRLGVTQWSSRLLAGQLKVSHKTVTRAWKAYGIKPWKAESFRFSADPELVGKVTDICGLYLGTNADVPANAIVLCVDEKSQIQALDRTVPILPMQPGAMIRTCGWPSAG